jgi:ABC-type sugar transport system ATPase subunit
MADTPLLSVRGLRKRYGGVLAVDNMNLVVSRGDVHAVVGENGAGKSTLMKALAGVVRPDAGEIEFDGVPIVISSPVVARQYGVGIVYQELSLFPQRSVLANLFVNREPLRNGLVSVRAMEERSADLLDRLGLRFDVHLPVSRLSIGEQQLVELARVLLEEPRLLILDEPNSALNERETQRLFDVLRQLNRRGITMLYVSHRLEEVFAICNRVTVTRNGRDVLTKDRADLTIPEVIEGMIGAPQTALFPPPLPGRPDREETAIVVKGLSGGPLKEVNFTARSGEVVGFAGLEGSGVAALFGVLFGAQKAQGGEVIFPDSRGLPRGPTDAARRGIALVPADRRRNGLMLDKSVLFNISQVAIGALKGGLPWFDHGTALERAFRQIDRLRIKTPSPYALAGELSGGNQQKTVVGKWLEVAPKVILLDDPTRGVDVGAKREIYLLIRRISAEGRIVLFSSTELPELIGLCDRIIVLYRGRIAGEIRGSEIEGRALLHAVNTGEMPRRRSNEKV